MKSYLDARVLITSIQSILGSIRANQIAKPQSQALFYVTSSTNRALANITLVTDNKVSQKNIKLYISDKDANRLLVSQ